MADCLIGAGSNLGDRTTTIKQALGRLELFVDPGSVVVSDWLETAPVGGPPSQHQFLNGAIRVSTNLSPFNLQARLQEIESALGRIRRERWGSRTLDLDLLLYDELQIETSGLTVPHPRMTFRPFVMRPAAQVAGDMLHPVLGATLADLWRGLSHNADAVWVLGDGVAAETASSLVEGMGPQVALFRNPALSQSPLPKLVIDTRPPTDRTPTPPAPTLWLTDSPSLHQSHEADTVAALCCVWPNN